MLIVNNTVVLKISEINLTSYVFFTTENKKQHNIFKVLKGKKLSYRIEHVKKGAKVIQWGKDNIGTI